MRRLEEARLVELRGGGSIYRKRLVRLTKDAGERMRRFLTS
jgi:hypothetical protein